MMRALIQLAPRTSGDDGLPPSVRELRSLAEYPEVGERAYVLEADASGALVAKAIEVDESTRYGFPFRRPSGPRSPQVGPVLKRTVDPKKGVGPNATTLAATLTHFTTLAASTAPVAGVYARCLDAIGGSGVEGKTARVVAALASIAEKKTTYVALGSPPGLDADYASHVLSVIRGDLYGIDDDAPEGPCPVCHRTARLGASALKGAKLNFLNSDNHGVFPGLDVARAGDRFSLCAACADGIANSYINLKGDLRVLIAGAPALVLPYIVAAGDAPESSRSAADVLANYRAGTGAGVVERTLLDALAEESALAAFHVLWATAGDSLDDVTGFITDVPCTRLGTLSAVNTEANAWRDEVFPARRARPFDLRLSLVGALLDHAGGDRVKRRNGARLGALRKQIARALYLGARLDPRVLMAEVRDMIADHLVDPTIEDRYVARNLTHEAPLTKKGDVILNAASWIRHVAMLLHYLRRLEVLPPMEAPPPFAPRSERVQRLLTAASGVDTDATRFAFLLGVLFGRLVVVQGARGVNVRSNALTWLRRATLTGADLPGLYVRIREKFAEYESERSPVLRELVHDVSELGARLGTAVALDADTTMYFLFLGQALAGDVFAKDEATPASEAP